MQAFRRPFMSAVLVTLLAIEFGFTFLLMLAGFVRDRGASIAILTASDPAAIQIPIPTPVQTPVPMFFAESDPFCGPVQRESNLFRE